MDTKLFLVASRSDSLAMFISLYTLRMQKDTYEKYEIVPERDKCRSINIQKWKTFPLIENRRDLADRI